MSESPAKDPAAGAAARYRKFPLASSCYPLLLSVLVLAVYGNTLQCPLTFDDFINIPGNLSIRHLWPISPVLAPPLGTGVGGRPIVNLSLALNYAISGCELWSYHLVNLLIHLGAALCLFGIIRRTLLVWRRAETAGEREAATAFACAALWALHPLPTHAVTYISQRFESLMGLFFLLTFYLALRGWQAKSGRSWHLAAILVFLLGAATKEVIAVAPVLLIAYERVFIHRSWRKIAQTSPLLYTGLACGWIVLGFLVAAGGTKASGTGVLTFTPLDYWRTEPEVISHYLRLFFWPGGLTMEYGWPIAEHWNWPATAFIALAIGIAFLLLIKGHPFGFLLAFVFTVLAPTTLVPLPDLAYDYRMYLPSTALATMAVLSFQGAWQRFASRRAKNPGGGGTWFAKVPVYLFILLLGVLGVLTVLRNMAYSSDVSVWGETVRIRPESSRAHANLGNALMQEGRNEEALRQLQEALRIETANARLSRYLPPEDYLLSRSVYVKAQDNIAWIRLNQMNPQAAIDHLRPALKIDPFSSTTLSYMGMALALEGKPKDAEDHFQRAIRIAPADATLRSNYGAFLRLQGRLDEARRQCEQAVALDPLQAAGHFGLGRVLFEQNRKEEAKAHIREALRLNPQNPAARKLMEQLDGPS